MGGHSDIQWEEDPKHVSTQQQDRGSFYHNSRPLWIVQITNRTRIVYHNSRPLWIVQITNRTRMYKEILK